MKVARDPVPIFEYTQPLLISSGIAELESNGRLTGKGLRHAQVGLREGRVRDEPAGHDRTARTGFTQQRKGHRMTHRHIRTKVQIDVRMLINRMPPVCRWPSCMARHAMLLLGRVPNSDELAFGRAGSDDDLQLDRMHRRSASRG